MTLKEIIKMQRKSNRSISQNTTKKDNSPASNPNNKQPQIFKNEIVAQEFVNYKKQLEENYEANYDEDENKIEQLDVAQDYFYDENLEPMNNLCVDEWWTNQQLSSVPKMSGNEIYDETMNVKINTRKLVSINDLDAHSENNFRVREQRNAQNKNKITDMNNQQNLEIKVKRKVGRPKGSFSKKRKVNYENIGMDINLNSENNTKPHKVHLENTNNNQKDYAYSVNNNVKYTYNMHEFEQNTLHGGNMYNPNVLQNHYDQSIYPANESGYNLYASDIKKQYPSYYNSNFREKQFDEKNYFQYQENTKKCYVGMGNNKTDHVYIDVNALRPFRSNSIKSTVVPHPRADKKDSLSKTGRATDENLVFYENLQSRDYPLYKKNNGQIESKAVHKNRAYKENLDQKCYSQTRSKNYIEQSPEIKQKQNIKSKQNITKNQPRMNIMTESSNIDYSEYYKKDDMIKYTIRKIPISQIKYAPVLTLNNDLIQFITIVNNFNSIIEISHLKNDFSVVLYEIFNKAMKNGGFFTKSSETIFMKILNKEYNFYKALYIKYVYPFEQFMMRNHIILIYEKVINKSEQENVTVEKNGKSKNLGVNNQKITSDITVQILLESPIDEVMRTIDSLCNHVCERNVINVMFDILQVSHKIIRNKKNIKTENSLQTDPIKKSRFDVERFLTPTRKQLILVREQSIAIIFNYIKNCVFDSVQFKEERDKIRSKALSVELFNVFLSHQNIMDLINILYERFSENHSCLFKNISIDSFTGLMIIYSRFFFLLKVDKVLYKFLYKSIKNQKIQVLTMLDSIPHSNNTKKKLFKRVNIDFLKILNDFNEKLKKFMSIEEIILVSLVVKQVCKMHRYNNILAEMCINIVKYNLEKRFIQIEKNIKDGLLDIFKIICSTKIVDSIKDFDLFMKASTLKDYDDVIKTHILNSGKNNTL